jgi:predicted PhzF superfamily epimerase YddE/YHI9
VTGSAQGCIGAAIARHGLLPSGDGGAIAYVASQGAEMERAGTVHVRCRPAGSAWVVQVGGAAVKVIEGSISV